MGWDPAGIRLGYGCEYRAGPIRPLYRALIRLFGLQLGNSRNLRWRQPLSQCRPRKARPARRGAAGPGAQLNEIVVEVSAQVYEPSIDMDRLGNDECESTPIFHALARRAGDPVEHFRRDPLRAPLPSTGPAAPAMTRMLLHAVPPTERGRAAGHARSSRTDATAHRSEEAVPTAAAHPEPRGIAEVASGRGGRHRALRSIGHG